jgi:hypothetical protein
MLAAFRHDVHKLTGESHENARGTFAGVPVNQAVPNGADSDGAALSRPRDIHEQTVPTHTTHYRLSLLSGETTYDPSESSAIESEIRELVTVDDAETAHERWLGSPVTSVFNESAYHPYTSVKYHTLLVAALLDNYRDGAEFSDLRLIVDSAGEVVPFRTIFAGARFALRINESADGNPAARLGSRPWLSWASVWSRLTDHPLDTDRDKYDMTLDANLRRIRSWSTALQYIEDFWAAFDR